MKKLYLVLSTFLSLIGYSQNNIVGIKEIIVPKTYWTVYYADTVPLFRDEKLYTGTDTSTFFSNGEKLLALETYKDGFKAELKTFYDNGKPERHYEYKNGKRNGINKGWYKSGMIMFNNEMRNGKIIGVSIMYNETGNPKSISSENDNFIMGFYENGKVRSFTKFIKDTLRCKDEKAFETKEWDENGQLMLERISNCGKQRFTEYYNDTTIGALGTEIDMPLFRVGKYTQWHPNGKVSLEAEYKDGNTQSEANIKIGVWKYYDEQGKLIKEEYYENSVLVKEKEYSKPRKLKDIEK